MVRTTPIHTFSVPAQASGSRTANRSILPHRIGQDFGDDIQSTPKRVKAERTPAFIVNNISGLGRKSSRGEWSSAQVVQWSSAEGRWPTAYGSQLAAPDYALKLRRRVLVALLA